MSLSGHLTPSTSTLPSSMSILSRSSLFSSLYSGWAFIPVSYTHLLQDASNERKKYIAKISEWSAHKIEAAEEEKRLMARYFNFISAFIEKEAKSEIIAKAFNLIEINKEMELLKKDELFPYIKKLYSETIQEFRDYDNINFVGGNEMARKYFCLLYTSQGLDVWGMKTRKCEVLYLCLEDSFNRLQDRLYSIADEYGIAIVVVHHLRKQADDNDPFNQISGTTGITGAVDTAFLITKDNRNDEVALLTATGRDIEQQRLILRFLKKVWTLEDHKGQAELRDEIIPQVVFKLVDFIKEQGKWEGTATELVAALGEEEKMVQTINRIINRFYYEVLAPNDIAYSTKRCANKRLIQLTNNDTIDSNDEE